MKLIFRLIEMDFHDRTDVRYGHKPRRGDMYLTAFTYHPDGVRLKGDWLGFYKHITPTGLRDFNSLDSFLTKFSFYPADYAKGKSLLVFHLF